MKKIIILSLIVVLLTACSREAPKKKVAGVAVPGSVTLVDLGSLHCKPCLMMMPILDTLKKKYQDRTVVKFINVDKDMDTALALKIMTIPTQILFDRQGKEVMRHVGFIPQDKLEKELNKIL